MSDERGRSGTKHRRLRVSTASVVLASAFLAIFAAAGSSMVAVGDANRRAITEELTGDTSEASAILGRLTEGLRLAPSAIAGLVVEVGPENLTRERYTAFAGPLLDTELLIALEWAPYVTGKNRTAFETAVHDQGQPSFAISDMGPDGTLVASPARDDYFPIEFAEPFADNQQAIGFDLGSESTRREAIMVARDTGQVTLTPPVQVAIGGTGVLLLVPVYAGGTTPLKLEERQAQFLGVTVSIYRPQALLDRATIGLRGHDVAFALFDLGSAATTADAGTPVLAAARNEGQAPHPDLATPAAINTTTGMARAITFGQRDQLLIVEPGPTYGNRVSAAYIPIGLAAGAALIAVALYAVQQRRLERAMAAAAARLRGVVAASPDAFVGLDGHGRIVDWSDQAAILFGLRRQDAVGRRISSLLELPAGRSETTARDLDAAMLALPAAGESIHLELTGCRTDGTLVPVEVTMAISTTTSARWRVACFVRDATERRRARDELLRARATEAIGQLTGRLAHDFNNLLGIIVGTLDLAREEIEDRPEALRLVDMAISAGIRGADVTKALLAVARRQALAPTDVDLNDAVADLSPLLRQAVGNGVEVMMDLHPEPLRTHLDVSGLTNAILNLVINASHAMPSGGRITIRTRPDGKGCLVEVVDTGTGMPPEVVSHAFDPFFTTKKGGSGLGLAIVHGFATQSGGSAEIESELGSGTTVRMHLPPAKGDAPVAAAPAAKPGTGSERIVVVDDEAGLREICAAWLRSAGYEVYTAASGPAGLDVVRSVQPALLLSDVIMPGGFGGLELAYRAYGEQPGLRVVLASGYAGVDLEGVIESGLTLVEKPYRRERLMGAVREALDSAPVDLSGPSLAA